MNAHELRELLESTDYGQGLTRDELRERFPELPDDVYLYLPASKRYLSAEDVLNQTGEHALARAEGEMAGPELELDEEGATADGGPPAWGPSLSPGVSQTAGAGDYPGELDDIGGSSIETSTGRGLGGDPD